MAKLQSEIWGFDKNGDHVLKDTVTCDGTTLTSKAYQDLIDERYAFELKKGTVKDPLEFMRLMPRLYHSPYFMAMETTEVK